MLQLLNVVKHRTAVRLTWAASLVASVWICGACMFYMVYAYTYENYAVNIARKDGYVSKFRSIIAQLIWQLLNFYYSL